MNTIHYTKPDLCQSRCCRNSKCCSAMISAEAATGVDKRKMNDIHYGKCAAPVYEPKRIRDNIREQGCQR
jgi:hypothetical protein